jgi:hypothetical protein
MNIRQAPPSIVASPICEAAVQMLTKGKKVDIYTTKNRRTPRYRNAEIFFVPTPKDTLFYFGDNPKTRVDPSQHVLALLPDLFRGAESRFYKVLVREPDGGVTRLNTILIYWPSEKAKLQPKVLLFYLQDAERGLLQLLAGGNDRRIHWARFLTSNSASALDIAVSDPLLYPQKGKIKWSPSAVAELFLADANHTSSSPGPDTTPAEAEPTTKKRKRDDREKAADSTKRPRTEPKQAKPKSRPSTVGIHEHRLLPGRPCEAGRPSDADADADKQKQKQKQPSLVPPAPTIIADENQNRKPANDPAPAPPRDMVDLREFIARCVCSAELSAQDLLSQTNLVSLLSQPGVRLSVDPRAVCSYFMS